MNISAVNLTRNFIRKRADSNILSAVKTTDLTLKEGTLTAVSGPSGSGKSTLLNMLSGLLVPTSGKVMAGETDLYTLDDKQLSVFRNRHFGVVPQGQTALMSLNVLENVMIPYTLYHGAGGSEYQDILKRSRELLEKAGLGLLEKEMPSALSGGEIRRMAVCRALVLNPEIVFADEPTGDLDEENTEIVMNMLKNHASEHGTVFVVTHDRQVWDYADDIYTMKDGVITANIG